MEKAILHLREGLSRLCEQVPEPVRADVRHALSADGKLFSPSQAPSPMSPNGAWGLFTYLLAHQGNTSDDHQRALQVALAVEVAACAIDIQDDLIDNERTPLIAVIGVQRAILVVSALLTLSEQAILAVSDAPVSSRALQETLLQGILETIAAQHLDLEAEGVELSVEESLALASSKGSGLMCMACLLAALAAGVSDLAPFTQLGTYLGQVHQIANDCQEIERLLESPGHWRGDVLMRKQTLPLVLAREEQRSTPRTSTVCEASGLSEQALRVGLMTAWAICLLSLQKVRTCLERIGPVSRDLWILLTGEGPPHA